MSGGKEGVDKITVEDVRRWGLELRNWGRWGADDERGTMNFITEEVVLGACRLPRVGRVVSCAIDFTADGPMSVEGVPGRAEGGRDAPVLHMDVTGAGLDLPGGFQYSDDSVEMTLQSVTQWDALSHAFYGDQLYNGRPSSVISEQGANANSIDKMRNGVVSRGVLLDVANYRGVECLEDTAIVLPEDLDACASAQGVEVRRGDVVLVRTGRVGRAVSKGWDPTFVFGPCPGLSVRCAPWLHGAEVAAVAVDNVGVETLPGEVENCMMPLHMICLRDMGLTFGEIFNLDPLSAACAETGRYEFLFTAAPLPFVGAVGSPINPLAII